MVLKPLDDPRNCIKVIADVSGAAPTEVARRLLAEVQSSGSNVREAMIENGVPMYITSKKLDEFYAQTDSFLYETSVWNYSSVKQDMRDFIETRIKQWKMTNSVAATTATTSSQPVKIFCFGDGLGFDSSFFASQGHSVQYFEPGFQNRRFANEVFRQNDSKVIMLESLKDIQPNSLDVIVCLDVLEHIANPQSVIELFRKWLKPDGFLFAHSPFWSIDPSKSTHLKENRKYSGSISLYAGFRAIDSDLFQMPIAFQNEDSDEQKKIPITLGARFRIFFGSFIFSLARVPVIAFIHTFVADTFFEDAPEEWIKILGRLVDQPEIEEKKIS